MGRLVFAPPVRIDYEVGRWFFMIYRKRAACFLLILSVFCSCLPAQAAVGVSARSAVLYDADLDVVLWQKDADQQLPMASTTKLMTALVAAQHTRPTDIVTAKAEYLRVEGSSMYLKAGEKLTMGELLHGLLLMSGNDAAQTIAGHIAGGNDSFAVLMNETAAALDMEHSHFMNPSGLDHEAHYTTANDMALLADAVLQNDLLRQIVATKNYHGQAHNMSNHNRLLSLYPDAVGMKTGFTKKSGRCLVSAAKRDGKTLICVTLNAPDDWNDHISLFEYGFSLYSPQELVQKGQRMESAGVVSGVVARAPVYAAGSLSVSLTEEQCAQVTSQVLAPQFVYAPVHAGRQYGELRFLLYGKELGRVPLCFLQDVPEEPELTLKERIALIAKRFIFW